jgi:hypothetical protein
MSPSLWAKLIANYVNAEIVPFDGTPTIEDCHVAHAAYMLNAPFDLRPAVTPRDNSQGRVSARTHIVVTNCITGKITNDEVVALDSDPPDPISAALEPLPEVLWWKAVPRQLARHPLRFPHVARIKSVQPPFAYIDLGDTPPMKVGDVLQTFANANGEKQSPILLTVTNPDSTYIQTVFSTTPGSTIPQAGDYVEPVSRSFTSARKKERRDFAVVRLRRCAPALRMTQKFALG